jgi:hypothetical protein
VARVSAPVGEEDGVVGAAVEAFAEDGCCQRRAHGDDGDVAAVALTQVHCQAQGDEVFGVVDHGEGGPVDGAVILHHLAGDVLGVGHLLGQHHHLQGHRSTPQLMGKRERRLQSTRAAHMRVL